MVHAIHMEYAAFERKNEQTNEIKEGKKKEKNAEEEEEERSKSTKPKKCRINITSLKRSLNKFTRQIDLIY